MIAVDSAHRRAVFLCALALGLAACKDEGPPEERVAALSVSSGDQQQAIVTTQVPQPIVVFAIDGQDRPVGGATVTWTVTTGGGTVTPVSARTDAQGHAGANWTLGPTAGPQTVTAAVLQKTVTVTATALPGAAATITVTPSPLTLDAVGATGQLQFEAKDAQNNTITGRTPAWSSTAPGVATVSSTGLVTATGAGSAKARATLDTAVGEADVMVAPVVTTITLNPPAATLNVGATTQFQASPRDRLGSPVTVPAGALTWSSSAPAIVSVSTTGLATALASGTAQVSAAVGSVTANATVTVNQVAATLTLSPKADTLTTARPSAPLTVVALDSNGQAILNPTVTWATSNALVATVSGTGVVTAVANGTARIRATSAAATDSATIVVRLNTAPKAVADVLATLLDTPLTVAPPGLLANDTLGIPSATVASFGGGSLTGTTVTTNAAGTTVTIAGGGSLRVNADGSVAFTPSTGFQGAFTFSYRVQNAAGTSDALVTINVGVPPVAVDDPYVTTAGTTLTVAAPGVLANDTGGFPAAVVQSFGGPSLASTVTSFAAGQRVGFGIGGFVQLNADGSLSFTPPTGFTGAFSFLYRIGNGVGTSDATITVTVN